MNLCDKCFTRMDGCVDCYEKKLDKAEALTVYTIETRDAELAAKDKEIARLIEGLMLVKRYADLIDNRAIGWAIDHVLKGKK